MRTIVIFRSQVADYDVVFCHDIAAIMLTKRSVECLNLMI
jgi:hypothetical protein